MTGLERYNAMLDGRPVDFVPRIPILMQFAAEHIGATFGAFCSQHAVKVEGNIRCAEDFGLDLVGVMSDAYTETQGFGAKIIYHDHATPECVRPPLADSTDLDQLPRPDPHTATRMVDRLQTIRDYVQQVAGQYTILGWVEGPIAEAGDLRGVQQIMIDLYDDPDWVDELMDRCVDTAIDFARAQVEAGADTIGVGDALASQVSRPLYEKHILPREIRLARAIRDTGARVRFHICGNITHLLDGLASVPLDVLDVDHMVDLTAVRRKMPARVTLGCNIDPVSGVLNGNPGSIRRTIAERYAQVANPFLVNAGCEIPPGTAHENLRALCEPLAYRA